MPAKRLENLLNPSTGEGLGDIVRHARDMGRLVHILREALPGEDAEGILAANIRHDGELVVLASTPAWAAKLRFETDKLVEAAQLAGNEVISCRVRVSRGD